MDLPVLGSLVLALTGFSYAAAYTFSILAEDTSFRLVLINPLRTFSTAISCVFSVPTYFAAIVSSCASRFFDAADFCFWSTFVETCFCTGLTCFAPGGVREGLVPEDVLVALGVVVLVLAVVLLVLVCAAANACFTLGTDSAITSCPLSNLATNAPVPTCFLFFITRFLGLYLTSPTTSSPSLTS